MEKIPQFLTRIQKFLFPFLEEELNPLTEKHKKLVMILEFIRIEDHIRGSNWLGRPQRDRVSIGKAFIAKMLYNLSSTVALIEYLKSSSTLRRLCGFERARDIPSEATFSRVFLEFSQSELPQRIHKALIQKYESKRLVGHISRDSTDIVGREKAVKKPKKAAPPKRKRGRPKKGERQFPKERTRLERQKNMTINEMLDDLPKDCDRGYKEKDGKPYHWRGYKSHMDWGDGEIPISCILTSASLHDSQAAIPLAAISAQRIQNCYDLMDAAYDAKGIKEYSSLLGHIPIIDDNPRKKPKKEMDPAKKRRFNERSTCERGFSFLKDNFGCSFVRVRGYQKVATHIMFGVLALTAQQLLKLGL